MNKLLQTPGGKVDKGETALSAAIRETMEETLVELEPTDLKYIRNDPEFNCEIFIARTIMYPEWTEPEKMTQWYPYDYEEYVKEAKAGRTTPSHTKFYREILGQIMVENIEANIKDKKESQETNNVGEPTEETLNKSQYEEDVPEDLWNWRYRTDQTPISDPWTQSRQEHNGPIPQQHQSYWTSQPPPYYQRPMVYYSQPQMQPQLLTQPYWPEATDDRWKAQYSDNIYYSDRFYGH
jgi:ADP-ribose pyrophosphatase YjhB (NUDIX family)